MVTPEEREEQEYLKKNRVEWRNNALNHVRGIIDNDLVDDRDVVVRDTLTNLMHWCADVGLDFADELRVAKSTFEAEVAGTP